MRKPPIEGEKHALYVGGLRVLRCSEGCAHPSLAEALSLPETPATTSPGLLPGALVGKRGMRREGCYAQPGRLGGKAPARPETRWAPSRPEEGPERSPRRARSGPEAMAMPRALTDGATPAQTDGEHPPTRLATTRPEARSYARDGAGCTSARGGLYLSAARAVPQRGAAPPRPAAAPARPHRR